MEKLEGVQITDSQWNRLPKVVKLELNRLSANEKYYQDKLHEMYGEEETNVYLSESYREDRKPLPKDSEVDFDLSPLTEKSIRSPLYRSRTLSCKLVDGKLQVRSSMGYVTVRPSCSNVITVDMEKF